MNGEEEYNEEGYETPSIAEIAQELRTRTILVDEAIGDLYRVNAEAAEAEFEYRLARARAFIRLAGEYKSSGEKVTVDYLNAQTDVAVETKMRRAKMAGGEREAALECLRSRRAQLSAVQTVANAIRAEIDFHRQGAGGGSQY